MKIGEELERKDVKELISDKIELINQISKKNLDFCMCDDNLIINFQRYIYYAGMILLQRKYLSDMRREQKSVSKEISELNAELQRRINFSVKNNMVDAIASDKDIAFSLGMMNPDQSEIYKETKKKQIQNSPDEIVNSKLDINTLLSTGIIDNEQYKYFASNRIVDENILIKNNIVDIYHKPIVHSDILVRHTITPKNPNMQTKNCDKNPNKIIKQRKTTKKNK